MKSANQLSNLLQKAHIARDAKDFDRCVQLCRKILKSDPAHPPTLWLIGLALHQSGRTSDAVRHYETLARIAPEPKVLANLALLYQKAGRFGASEKTYQKLLAIEPSAQVWNNLGTLYHAQKRAENAVKCYEEALKLEPDRVESSVNLGMAHNVMGATEEAARILVDQAQRVANTASKYQIAKALEVVNAEQAFELLKDIASQDSHAPSLYALAWQYLYRGLGADARSCVEQALEAQPDFPNAAYLLAELLAQEGQFEDAIARLNRLPTSSERDGRIASIRSSQAVQGGRLEDVLENAEIAYRLMPDIFGATSRYLFNLGYSPAISPEDLFRLHRKIGRRVGATLRGALPPPDAIAWDGSRRLRVGLVSGDFRQHAVSFFIVNLLTHIDKERFELFAYSNARRPDSRTEELKTLLEHWRPINDMEDLAVASAIRSDQIDVLIDLSGYTTDTRLPVFAARPAPIQITWLGYLNTTALPEMDYRITDSIADPEPAGDGLSTEKLLRMPETFLNFKPLMDVVITEAPCVDSGVVTFASFNFPLKHNDTTFQTWAKILARVGGSRLLLKDKAYADADVVQHMTDRFSRLGVSADRLEFLAFAADMSEHLATYNRADIALDPFPYNGITTTCDALCMGMPVICLNGDRHSSRVSASFLKNLGLDELIASSAEDYIERACQLAADTGRIKNYKQNIRQQFYASSLGDGEKFTRQFEELLIRTVSEHERAG